MFFVGALLIDLEVFHGLEVEVIVRKLKWMVVAKTSGSFGLNLLKHPKTSWVIDKYLHRYLF